MLKLPKMDMSGLKKSLINALKTSLTAFILLCFASLLIAIVFNFIGMDFLKSIVIGNLGDDGGTLWGRIVKVATLIMNLSLFVKINEVQLGIIIFSILPFGAFYLAKNKSIKNGITMMNVIGFLTSSLVFAVLMSAFDWMTKGDFLGVQVKMVSILNFLWVLCYGFFIQFIIAINYNKQAPSYIRASRFVFRLIMGVGAVLGLIELIFLKAPLSILERIVMILAFLPNMIAYKALMIMGNEMQMSYTVSKAYAEAGNIHISISELPIGLRVGAVCLFGILLGITIFRIDKEKFWFNNILFSFIFSSSCTFIAVMSTIQMGTIILVGDIFLGYNLVIVFLIPMITCLLIGLIIWMIRKLIEVVAEA